MTAYNAGMFHEGMGYSFALGKGARFAYAEKVNILFSANSRGTGRLIGSTKLNL